MNRPAVFACGAQAISVFCLAAQSPPAASVDSAFFLSTTDVTRTPSPFIGNGRLGVVIPALGIGATHSFKAGLYEQGPGDVPRIVAVPAWNAVSVFDGQAWIEARPARDSSVRAYRQVVDMRTGTAHTAYQWENQGRRTAVRIETFVSRAAPHLTAIQLDVTPQQAGRLRVRFGLVGWPPPRRLALATLARAERSWKPADIWYPGYMVVRSRESKRETWGARLSMSSTPAGRTSSLAQAAAINWAMDLNKPTTTTTASGDTALVEIAFDAAPGRTYTFSQLASMVSSQEAQRPLEQAEPRAGGCPLTRI